MARIKRAVNAQKKRRKMMKLAGPDSKAGAIVLSLPVSEIAGLRKQEN